MSSDPISQLPPLLPTTPYLLAYALPLILLSLTLTFAGTFLTLDRTRSFPPASGAGATYAPLPIPGGFNKKPAKSLASKWILEGGVGGLVGGYAFGVHLATALALLIPATTSSSTLSPNSFLAVWLLSSIVTTCIAGRYRLATFLFLGISGGTLTALALCIITHPALQSRIILTAIFLPLFTLLVLMAGVIPRITYTLLHPMLRICTASTGSFGVIVAISLLVKPQERGWANAWERLWISDGEWGSSKERGLSAAWAVFFIAGMVTDWALRRWIGECPDEKWDNYLASYTSNLPNLADRAGTFRPPRSIWDRIFPPPDLKRDIVFPNETNPIPLPVPTMMRNVAPDHEKLSYDDPPKLAFGNDVLKKKRSKAIKAKKGFTWKSLGSLGGRKQRKPLKFGGEMSSDSDLSDDEDPKGHRGDGTKTSTTSTTVSPSVEHKQLSSIPPKAKRPPLRSNSNSNSGSTTPTLVDRPLGRRSTILDQEIMALRRQRGALAADDEELDYSDYEERTHKQSTHVSGEMGERTSREGGWSPAFLTKHLSQNSRQGHGHVQTSSVPPIAPVPVPATPSLLRALDRVAVAQRAAYGIPTSPLSQSQPQSQSQSISSEAGKAHRKKRPLNSTSNPTTPSAAKPSETYEDAEAGRGKSTRPKRMSEERGGEDKTQRSPRWEEFWREVRVKAQT
ncbi:hypothetical protein M413DRAFT_443775 [Hebeloma cylindrosporum]|uniref:DUF4203 domain-containing protein n=1 Tax=Hebeloma cylindrosporum TaxID=76867 RepID=A0A0C2XZA2_HEBCY|nr:hypothetical protein M413DRAFT_443775 [Hebeloma cylindrosporum h7]